jgi:hypothetical protein
MVYIHFSHAVREVLNNTYHDRWIGGGGPGAWPPRSTPDLIPSDFYVWGHLTTLVCAASLHSEEEHRIADVCQSICNYPSIFERMRRSMMRLA